MVIREIENCACEPGLSPCDECQRREFFEWNWDKSLSESTTVFRNNDREVLFNPGFSVGTVAVRGTIPFQKGYHHYWEIEMNTEVYGTDMMIGVGTEKTDLKRYSHNFVSLIGLDDNSWGLSYMGESHHAGETRRYTKAFGQHAVVGVHLDLWRGTLEYYLNRKPQGVAFKGLNNKTLYPLISSTAARSGMNLIFCRSYPPSLQLHTVLSLSRNMLLPDNTSLFKVLALPPGLKMWMKNNYWWIVSSKEESKLEKDNNEKHSPQSGSSSSPQPSQKNPRKKQKVLSNEGRLQGISVPTNRNKDSATTPVKHNESKTTSPESEAGPSSSNTDLSGRVLRSSTAAAAAAAAAISRQARDSENTDSKRMCLRSSVKKK